MLILSSAAEGRPARELGLVVLRGPTITLISPTDGYEGELWPEIIMTSSAQKLIFPRCSEIENPFAQAE